MNPALETREFKITGGAELFGKSRSQRKGQGQGSRKQTKQQGGQVNVQKQNQQQQSGGSADAIVGAGVNIVNGRSVMTAGALPLGTRTVVSGYDAPLRAGAPISGAPVLGAPVMRGGQQQQQRQEQQQQGGRKVELTKPLAQHRKVLLNPKKYKIAGETHQHPRTKTRKVRKITLGMKTMQKRLTRAKKIHTDVKEIPLADLRKQLIKRKLIRETSKAPESILRQIAADSQIVAGKGL
jgi:hypothetical protein